MYIKKAFNVFFKNTSQVIITACKTTREFVKINQISESCKTPMGIKWSFKDSESRKETALIFMLIILQWPNVQPSNFTKTA